jgi:hypothetical protein
MLFAIPLCFHGFAKFAPPSPVGAIQSISSMKMIVANLLAHYIFYPEQSQKNDSRTIVLSTFMIILPHAGILSKSQAFLRSHWRTELTRCWAASGCGRAQLLRRSLSPRNVPAGLN